jgi:hypothetical protein
MSGNVLAPHPTHETAPAELVDPSAHAMHPLETVMPSVVEYFPAAHRMQPPAPSTADAPEYVPAAHIPQLVLPTSPLYVPGGHALHVLAPPYNRDE